MMRPNMLITTSKGMENLVANRVKELIPEISVVPKPKGFLGIVLAYSEDPKGDARTILSKLPEVAHVYVFDALVEATLDDICSAAIEVARKAIPSDATFAVRTERRGSHDFTSLDVNVRVGEAVRKATGADVNLSFPDFVIRVEIIQDVAGICLLKGEEEIRWKKGKPWKHPVREFLRKISWVQVPYLGPLDACRAMGVRIGRAAQTFEVGELVVALKEPCPAEQLSRFLFGIFEGIRSRLEVQKRTYAFKVSEVPVSVYELHQLVRARRDELLIATSTRGEPLSRVGGALAEKLREAERINVLIGSREGLPVGVMRLSDFTIDVCPGLTLSTDFAGPAVLSSLVSLLERYPSTRPR